MSNINLQEISIKYFNSFISKIDNNDIMVQSTELLRKSIKFGYVIVNDAPLSLWNYFNEKDVVNYNTTFYRTWEYVTSLSLTDIYIDKVKHYTSTYGTNYEAEPFIVNDNPIDIDFTSFKKLDSITLEEFKSRCVKLLYSNTGLSTNTMNDILLVVDALNLNFDIELVKNNELKLIIMAKMNILPNSNKEFVRFLVYKATQKTLLINNNETINLIKNVNQSFDSADYIRRYGMEKLSESFYRFKDILLAFKNKNNAQVFNKLRKLAKKYHKPTKKNPLDIIISTKSSEVYENFVSDLNSGKITNFKKIALLNLINHKLKNTSDYKFYLVRNQKMFIKNVEANSEVNIPYLMELYNTLYDSLINSIRKNLENTCIILPKDVELALPSSEKSFVGNYPMGSVFNLQQKNTIVGIHWRGSDGAKDLDLSLLDESGNKIGWNSNYSNYNKTVVYSGDMTSANPEATELMYFENGVSNDSMLVKVNGFNANINAKFRMFLANEYIANMERSYMVDKNNIKFDIECSLKTKGMILGVILDSKFVLCNFSENNKAISSNTIFSKYIGHIINTSNSTIKLSDIVNSINVRVIENVSEANDGEVIIDLSTPTKDGILNILS